MPNSDFIQKTPQKEGLFVDLSVFYTLTWRYIGPFTIDLFKLSSFFLTTLKQ